MSPAMLRVARTTIDLLALTAAFWVAWLMRFDWDIPFQWLKQATFMWAWVIALQYLALSVLEVPRFSWRHVGLREANLILLAIGCTAGVLTGIRLVAGYVLHSNTLPYARYVLMPLGVIAGNLALAFLLTTGVRVLWRIRCEWADASGLGLGDHDVVPTMLVGAGSAGLQVVKELARRPDLGMRPVGFVDDDPLKKGTLLHGTPVLGPTAQLEELCLRQGAEQVLITIASATGPDIRRIKGLCDDADLPVKIIPAIREIVGGVVGLSMIRDVAIEDLLGREPVVLDEKAISEFVREKVVLVTGAGGSIGSELCRQLCRFKPSRLVLVERAESNLFQIERELRREAEAIRVHPALGDVCNLARMQEVFQEHSPQVVFHAAAHKHVPMLEENPTEAIRNNVFGTRQLADLASEHAVQAFVLVSTDKAVNPSSVMGASKRVAEIYTQALSPHSETRFVTVRFGNVLGSVGSVVPIFRGQIARGGPVTVTHPDMKRYFMTIPEASQLILEAASMGEGGEVFILDMGDPVKIVDLAHDLIRLSGLKPDQDIEIAFTGVRPGEKLSEELALTEEHADKTRHPKIFVGNVQSQDREDVDQALRDLEAVLATGDHQSIRAKLGEIVPEYRPSRGEDSVPQLEPTK